MLLTQERWAKARSAYQQCLAIDPNETKAWHNIALALQKEGKLEEAIQAHLSGFHRAPPTPETHAQYADCLLAAGRRDEAETLLRDVVDRDPTQRLAWMNLGTVLARRGELREAETAASRAVAMNPRAADAQNLLGNILAQSENYSGAIAAYECAAKLAPDHPTPRANAGMIKLLIGDFAGGWADYEWRDELVRLQVPLPRWHSDAPLLGRSLLVHAEQGFGDTLQFSRYVPLLAAFGAHVHFVVHPPLRSLRFSSVSLAWRRSSTTAIRYLGVTFSVHCSACHTNFKRARARFRRPWL